MTEQNHEPRLVREVIYLSGPQIAWLRVRAAEIGISRPELLRGIVQAAKEADERRRWASAPLEPPLEPGPTAPAPA